MTRRIFGILGKLFAKYIFFNQTQALYNLPRCVAHSILAIILRKVPQKVIASQSVIVIWGDFTYFLNNALEHGEV